LPPFDVYAPLLDLPYLLNIPDPSQAPPPPYLFADAQLTAQWKAEFDSLGGFKIGINWQGNPKQANDRQRSMALSKFLPLARVPGVRLVSLQKGFGSEQVHDFPARDLLLDLGSRL